MLFCYNGGRETHSIAQNPQIRRHASMDNLCFSLSSCACARPQHGSAPARPAWAALALALPLPGWPVACSEPCHCAPCLAAAGLPADAAASVQQLQAGCCACAGLGCRQQQRQLECAAAASAGQRLAVTGVWPAACQLAAAGAAACVSVRRSAAPDRTASSAGAGAGCLQPVCGWSPAPGGAGAASRLCLQVALSQSH